MEFIQVNQIAKSGISVLERAAALHHLRNEWEAKHGKVASGRPNSGNLGFYKAVQDHTKISRASLIRLNRIWDDLVPEMKAVLIGTPTADNQDLLLRIAKADAHAQRVAASSISEGEKVEAAVSGLVAQEHSPEAAYRKFVAQWVRLDVSQKRQFLATVFDAALR